MPNYQACDPYRTLMYERGDSRQKVTLARVFGLVEGSTYKTVEFLQRVGAEGAHMREKVKARRQLRGL
jgi:hypothetical protein